MPKATRIDLSPTVTLYHETGKSWMLARWSERDARYEAYEPTHGGWAEGTVLWGRSLEALFAEAGTCFESKDAAMSYFNEYVAAGR